ncbi:MAG: methyltransferase, TIGR04325 family [Burkholderiales bacterium]|nr:methyltransferase, TIGR04325 family [Bacteroidia bacterium]
MNKIFNRLFYKKNETDKAYGWSGNYSNWSEVNKLCKGYDDNIIFEKVKQSSLAVKLGKALFERDSVLFYEEDYSEYFLKIINEVAKENSNTLNVLDFGGALGSLYYQYKSKFDDISDLKWNIVEQAHFVDFGKKELETEQLKFYPTIEECLLNNKINIVILSSVISYFESPYQLLNNIFSHNFNFILIDKTIFTDYQNDILTLQTVPPTIYEASYPCWVLNKNNVTNFMSKKYSLQSEYFPYGNISIKIDKKTAYFKALLFKINDI